MVIVAIRLTLTFSFLDGYSINSTHIFLFWMVIVSIRLKFSFFLDGYSGNSTHMFLFGWLQYHFDSHFPFLDGYSVNSTHIFLFCMVIVSILLKFSFFGWLQCQFDSHFPFLDGYSGNMTQIFQVLDSFLQFLQTINSIFSNYHFHLT